MAERAASKRASAGEVLAWHGPVPRVADPIAAGSFDDGRIEFRLALRGREPAL